LAHPTWFLRPIALAALALAPSRPVLPQTSNCSGIEEFLLNGQIGAQHGIPVGVTLPSRATIEYKGTQHDAAIQTVDVFKEKRQTTHGIEMNFRDSWKYNVAGYELAKILELNMVPPYVERSVNGQKASLSWWVNDAMTDADRVKQKLEPPDPESWNQQMLAAEVFHQLIYDTDANRTNLLITKDWQIWMIDSTRAFRTGKNLPETKNLVRCDRKLLARLRTLDKDVLKEKLSRWLTGFEIDGLAARARKMVELFDKETASKGEAMVLYDFPRTSQPCGTGL
jgi:hypothetical protein